MRYILTIAFLIGTMTAVIADTKRGIQFYDAGDYDAAGKEFLGPVAAGDPVAIRYYAHMLYRGLGGTTDRPLADKLLRKSYTSGDTASGSYLAYMITSYAPLRFSGYKDEDYARMSEATKLFEETYNGPTYQEPASSIVKNFLYTDGKVRPKGNMIIWLKRAVREGHSESAWQLAKDYSNGNGVEKNTDDAFYWAEYAAFLGNSEAQTIVGRMYFEGRAGPPRPDAGIALIVQAAEDRHNPAMLLVAEHYASEGSNRDLGMAWRVLHLAYDRGLEKSDRSERLSKFLFSRRGNEFARSIGDSVYNQHFEGLINLTEPDYQAALRNFESRRRPHSE